MFELAESAGEEVRNAVGRIFPDFPSSVAEQLLKTLEAPTGDLCSVADITLEKPYGKNHILRLGPDYGLSFACLLPGASTSLHYHRERRELFFVRAGHLCFTFGEQERCLDVGEWAFSIPGVIHRVANRGEQLLEIVEIFAPALLDDKHRVADAYGRPLGDVTFRM
jgi:mannose-6-phosphate isomerase-like protein (cupin superfamily)